MIKALKTKKEKILNISTHLRYRIILNQFLDATQNK